jgi:putative ABC transport system permease protein
MHANNLKVFFRNTWKYKGYTFTNLFGLAAAMTTAILIFLWVLDEISYDAFHTNIKQINRVMIRDFNPDGTINTHSAPTVMLGDVLPSEAPEIEKLTQLSWETEALIQNDQASFSETGVYATPAMFSIFSFPLLHGNSGKPLPDISSVAISGKLAKKLFGDVDPIGKTLRINKSRDFNVSAVFADIPENSTLQFDFVLDFDLWKSENTWARHWKSGATQAFVTLKSNASLDLVNERIKGLVRKNCSDCSREVFLFPFAKEHLYGGFENGINTGGRIERVVSFGWVALIILLMACINVTNLATARSATRAKEIGVRKSVGASGFNIGFQFIGESMLWSVIALIIALGAVYFLIPVFNDITGKHVHLDFTNGSFSGDVLLVGLVCGILAGVYPAFLFSSIQPKTAFKNQGNISSSRSILRKTLVVSQFVASTVLIVGTLVIYNQLRYIQTRDMGFSKERIIAIDQSEDISKHQAAFKQSLLQIPSVREVAFVGSNIFSVPITTSDPVWAAKPAGYAPTFKVLRCDEGFIPAMDIKLIAGRNFTNVNNEDASNYVINRRAMETMGLTLETVLGANLEMWNGKGRIIGVTADFMTGNFRENTMPLIMMFTTSNGAYHFVKMEKGADEAEVIAKVKEVFKHYEPNYPFQYSLLDESFRREYQSEFVMGDVSLGFALIGIVICCLGLLGLSSFTAERRTKELGIRKIFGANAGQLVSLLSWEFLKLVCVALAIGCPVAWYLSSQYLSIFAFHVSLSAWFFAAAAAGIVIIALLTVAFQSIKAATSNPVRSLRNE